MEEVKIIMFISWGCQYFPAQMFCMNVQPVTISL